MIWWQVMRWDEEGGEEGAEAVNPHSLHPHPSYTCTLTLPTLSRHPHTPYTLTPKPYPLNPKHSALTPGPSTLSPQPLNPIP